MRLVIDIRLLGHSGIGTYVSNVLPGVLQRCAALRPLLLALPSHLPRARVLADGAAEVRPWAAQPLSIAEAAPPPGSARGDLWWSPHFNVPILSRSALVVTLHDLLPLSDADRNVAWHKRLAVRLWLSAIRQRARRVICVSEFTRDQAVRIGGVRFDKTDVVHLGVDPAWMAHAASRNPASPPYLVFVGLVKRHKNLLGLLRAFEILLPAIPHRLIVIGRHTGLRDVDVAALALAQRLGPRVELLENVEEARLIRIVADADVLIQPSFHEGFGLPPLEAMAVGTPVLAARVPALEEVCGVAVEYFDPRSPADIAAAIRRLVNDPLQRDRLRARGRRRAHDFTWQACAAATSEALLAAWSER